MTYIEEVREDINLANKARSMLDKRARQRKVERYYKNNFQRDGYYTLLSNALNEDFTVDVVKELDNRLDLTHINWNQFFKDMRYETSGMEIEGSGKRVRMFILSRKGE